jgi:hypothetical protein
VARAVFCYAVRIRLDIRASSMTRGRKKIMQRKKRAALFFSPLKILDPVFQTVVENFLGPFFGVL